MPLVYRAAPAQDPYFGRGSYWTTSAEFAACFAMWANGRPKLEHLGTHVIYRAEVELVDVLEYAEPLSPEIIDACADLVAAQGYQWAAFRERGSTDGLDPVFAALVASCMQYVYLGEVSIPAERDDPARRR